MRKIGLCLLAVVALLAQGCATRKTLPSAYLGGQNRIAIQVVRIGEKPEIQNSSMGTGGLAGALAVKITDSLEARRLMKKMGEVRSEDVVKLTQAKVEEAVGAVIPVSPTGNNLLMEIEIEQWGWRRNVGLLVGPALAALSSTITARVTVLDVAKGRVKVAETRLTGEERVGRSPDPEDLRRGLEISADNLGEEIRAFLEAERRNSS